MKKLIFLLLVFFSVKGFTIDDKKGTFVLDSIYSQYLQKYRKMWVYLPPNYDNRKVYPVIYATDGNDMYGKLYKNTFDSLINHKKLPELIFVGVFVDTNRVENTTSYSYRQIEYLKNKENSNDVFSKRYNNYVSYFTKEVPLYVQQKYGASSERKDNYFYGCSNGAAFGLTLSIEKPEWISKYILFSLASGNFEDLKKGVKNYPYIDLAYGKDEIFPLVESIKEYDEFLTKNNYKHHLTIYHGGHDRNEWRELFFKRLQVLMN